MPGVVSLSQDEARATLEEAGLEPDFTNEDSTEVEADHVISTDPPEGEEVEVGATVSVVLSSGPDSGTVPEDRKSTSLNCSHVARSYAGFCARQTST